MRDGEEAKWSWPSLRAFAKDKDSRLGGASGSGESMGGAHLGWQAVTGSIGRVMACGDQATVACSHACTQTDRDTRAWAVVGRWQAGPTNLNFSLNFKISTNFEMQNEGRPDVKKYSNSA
jgi:hypothetical protein